MLPAALLDAARQDARFTAVQFAAGAVLVEQDVALSTVTLIEAGRVVIEREQRGKKRVVQVLRGPTVVGDAAVLAGTRSMVCVRAATDITGLQVSASNLTSWLMGDEARCRTWLVATTRRYVLLQRRVALVLVGDVRGVVAGVISNLAVRDRFDVTQTELADMAGASRASVNKALAELESGGFIQRGYGTIRVLDRDGLRGHAGL